MISRHPWELASARFRPSRGRDLFRGYGNGTKLAEDALQSCQTNVGAPPVNGIIYLVGLVVVIMAILSFLGMH
jgi:hypothetical protein